MSEAAVEPFTHPSEHLIAELEWARALVRGYLEHTGRLGPEGWRMRRGLGITLDPDEAAALLEVPPQTPKPPGEAALLRRRIDARVAVSRQAGLRLPLPELAEAFSLDELSHQLLILALASEIDDGIRRLFAYVADDLTRRHPTVEFLLGLLQPATFGRLLNASAFFFDSPLVRHRLLRPFGEGDAPWFARDVRVERSVVARIIGGRDLDPSIAHAARLTARNPQPVSLVYDDAIQAAVRRDLDQLRAVAPTTIALVGPGGTGKTEIVRQALGEALEVRVLDLLRPVAESEERIRVLARDALALAVPIVLDLADADQEDPALTPACRRLASVCGAHRHGVVVTARDDASWFIGLLDAATIHRVPFPTTEERLTIWYEALIRAGIANPDLDTITAAARFPISGAAIHRASEAIVARYGRGSDMAHISFEQVADACRAQLTPRLQGVAQRVVTTFVWDDLILPPEERRNLQEIADFAKQRTTVFDRWGYGRILPYGRGLTVLFGGPPGTGKTMAAGIIGTELGMEVFRVDLSRTVSKYIGETEKNLGRIFDEAARSHSILLFDEADSLFAKRTEVKSSVDRYANLEVNYLLQRMEDFDGVTILTTNFEGSIDEAFRRRIRFRVNFPSPDAATRKLLWERMVPKEAPVDEALDFEALAEEFDLSGGYIKNAAVRAAFLAASAGTGLRMKYFRRSARLELVKLGRVMRVYDDDEEEGG
jgi:AAA+ superfamily predicted ATPase